jgi:hypothetical protein
MTEAEAQLIREAWEWWGNSPCPHPTLELELNEGGDLTGDYHCSRCGTHVPKSSLDEPGSPISGDPLPC